MSLHAFHSVGMIVADSYDDLGMAPAGQIIWVKEGATLKQCVFQRWTKTWTWDRPNAHGCSDCTHTQEVVVKNCQVNSFEMDIPELKETDDQRV